MGGVCLIWDFEGGVVVGKVESVLGGMDGREVEKLVVSVVGWVVWIEVRDDIEGEIEDVEEGE